MNHLLLQQTPGAPQQTIQCNMVQGRGVQKVPCDALGELLCEVDRGGEAPNAMLEQSCQTTPLYPGSYAVLGIVICYHRQGGCCLNGFDK